MVDLSVVMIYKNNHTYIGEFFSLELTTLVGFYALHTGKSNTVDSQFLINTTE